MRELRPFFKSKPGSYPFSSSGDFRSSKPHRKKDHQKDLVKKIFDKVRSEGRTYLPEPETLDVLKANSVNADMKEHVIETIENIETNKFAKYSGQTVLVKVSYDLKLY